MGAAKYRQRKSFGEGRRTTGRDEEKSGLPQLKGKPQR